MWLRISEAIIWERFKDKNTNKWHLCKIWREKVKEGDVERGLNRNRLYKEYRKLSESLYYEKIA